MHCLSSQGDCCKSGYKRLTYCPCCQIIFPYIFNRGEIVSWIIYTMMLGFLLGSLAVNAEDLYSDTSLKFENLPFKNAEINCDNDDRLDPKSNDFELHDYAVMSSELGERFALLMIKNTSSGQRILNQEHIVAIFGNCERKLPNTFEQKFSSGESLTVTVNFGLNRFPIVKLLME